MWTTPKRSNHRLNLISEQSGQRGFRVVSDFLKPQTNSAEIKSYNMNIIIRLRGKISFGPISYISIPQKYSAMVKALRDQVKSSNRSNQVNTVNRGGSGLTGWIGAQTERDTETKCLSWLEPSSSPARAMLDPGVPIHPISPDPPRLTVFTSMG